MTPKQQKKHDDARIERAYRSRCLNIAIPMMRIVDIFKVGHEAIAAGADDAALETKIAEFVDTIRFDKAQPRAEPIRKAIIGSVVGARA